MGRRYGGKDTHAAGGREAAGGEAYIRTHRIKLLDEFADDVLEGRKPFEIRENDRGYQKGDHVIFEVITKGGAACAQHQLNGREYEITYVLNGWGIKNGYVVFGIRGGGGVTRGEITKNLSRLTEKLINPHRDPRIYWAREVTFDYSTTHAIRVDYMQFKPVNNSVSGIEKGDFYCYEIKSSVEDFHSKNGHNFIGDYNYYIMPHDVYTEVKGEIPTKSEFIARTGRSFGQ